jgi:Co/Zn/Cd efflux system component
MCGML